MSEKINTQNEHTEFFSKQPEAETYQGRQVIKPGSRIEGGVLLNNHGEATVVDPEKHPDQYNRILEKAVEKATVDDNISRGHILNAVFDTVRQEMPYSQTGVNHILDSIATKQGKTDFTDGTKVDLASFIEHGVGVSHHQALATGFMLEKFKDAGYIRGEISIERDENYKKSHEIDNDVPTWIRYKNSKDKVIIMYPARNFIGSPEEAKYLSGFDYLRPEEKEEYIAPKLGKIALGK